MRLCYVVTHSMTTRFLRGQLARMHSQGFEVTLLASPGAELQHFEDSENVRVVPVPMEREIRPLRDLKSLVRLYREFRFSRPQVVNAGTPKAGLLGMLAAWAARVPVRIYTLHGLRLETAGGIKLKLLSAMERLAMRCAHRVICVSSSLRESCLQHQLAPPEKLAVLGSGSCNGIDTSSYCTPQDSGWTVQRTELRRRAGIEGDAFVLGAVGRITRDKGIADVLAVFDRVRTIHPTTHLLVIGDFENADPPPASCMERITTEPAIHWTGQVADTTPYYSAMDVLVHASSREGLPYAPMEAAAAGIPVVGYRVTGVVDAVRHDQTGHLTSPGDVNVMAEAVCRYLADPSLRRRHGQAGRFWIEREFSQGAVWNQLRDEYLRLLREKKVARSGSLSQRESVFNSLLAKRLFDLAITVPTLLALAPLMAAVAILVRWRLGGPVLFWQQRPGHHGRLFWMPKFRTMTARCDPAGKPLPDEKRLTSFGRWLRSTSLDELPELWCVLRGHMTLVGPRPLLTEYLSCYTPEQSRRHDVKPGITGWAQVNGRNAISWEEKFRHDLWYVDHHSLALDLRILLRTITAVLSRKAVTADFHATMPRFDSQTTVACHEHAA